MNKCKDQQSKNNDLVPSTPSFMDTNQSIPVDYNSAVVITMQQMEIYKASQSPSQW